MGGGANLYSIEAISDALIGAGSIAANSRDEQQIIRGYLVPLQNVLQAECVVFYPSDPAPLVPMQMIRMPESGYRLELSPTIRPAIEAFIRSASHQTITSHDPAFMLGHLRGLSGACASGSSMWSSVPAGDMDFGNIGVLDGPPREFGRVEQQVLRTFALQLSYALKSLLSRRPQRKSANKSSSREVDRYIESTKLIGNVARDLINPLTAIMGYVDLLKAEGLTERGLQYLQKLQAQTEKMQDIVMALNSAPPARPKVNDADNDGETILEKETPSTSSIALVPPLHPLSMTAEILQTYGNANGKSLAQRSPTGLSRVLLIQKSHAVMEFQRTVLSALNAEVITAGSGVEALALLQSDDVHAVILDDELEGEWRGKKLLVWIQENRPDLRNRLLMTISPMPKEETRDMIETLGIAHVTKPHQILELSAGVNHLLR